MTANMLINSLERLEETIDQETSSLAAHNLAGQEEFNRRKSQSLLELSRIVRTLQPHSLDEDTVSRLRQIRDKLELNHSVLERHLRAVQEVTDVISGAIQSADSDGTYSASIRTPG